MTSTTLKPKSNLGTAFSKVFKQSLLNTLLALGASVFVAVLAIITTIDGYSSNGGTLENKIDLTTEASVVICIISIIAGFFSLSIAPKMFKEIYKKQSCDFYFATPIKREEYFLANYLFGLLCNAVCFVVPGALYNTIMNLASNKNYIFTIDYAKYFSVVIPIFLAVIAIYSAFVMCAVISGRRIHYLLLSMICLFCTTTVTGGIIARINSIWGAFVDSLTLSGISPVENALMCAFSYGDKDYALLWIISVIEIAGMFAAGFIAFKRRKAEVAEVALSGKVIPYILLAVLCAAAYMYSTFSNGFMAILVGIILAVLMTMAFSGIFYKKVFTKQTGITAICVCVVCTVFTALVYFPMHNSYVKYAPEASEVKSVEISNTFYNGEFRGVISLLNNFGFGYDLQDTVKIESEQGIANAIALHQKTFDDTVMDKSKQRNNMSVFDYIFDESYIDENTFDYCITYHLENGRTVTRSYSVLSSCVKDEFINFAQSEEVLSQLEPFNIDSSMIAAVDGYRYDYEDVSTDDEEEYYEKDYPSPLKFENFDYDKFKECYMKDMLSYSKSQFSENTGVLSYFVSSYDDYENADIFSDYYDDSFDASLELRIYYILDTATEEEINEIKKLSDQEVIRKYEERFYNDTIAPIEITYVSIDSSDKETIKYLRSCGVDLK
ncbi:MAG: hypothetical protein NC397_09470 [Clostridium sp.]|nr:hypothetical protein [Clostridium sp.]